MAALAVLVAVPFGALGILDPDRVSSLALLFVAMVLMASVLGPCNTVTANVVPPNRRAAGYALSIFLIHLFGDISSPILIGLHLRLVRPAGRGRLAARPACSAVARRGPAGKPPTNLTVGMLSVIPVLAAGRRLLPARLAAPARRPGPRPRRPAGSRGEPPRGP